MFSLSLLIFIDLSAFGHCFLHSFTQHFSVFICFCLLHSGLIFFNKPTLIFFYSLNSKSSVLRKRHKGNDPNERGFHCVGEPSLLEISHQIGPPRHLPSLTRNQCIMGCWVGLNRPDVPITLNHKQLLVQVLRPRVAVIVFFFD